MKEAVRPSKSPPGVIRFGNFEVDTRAGELRRSGVRLKLSGQPFDVLSALLDKPGQVVTREELHEKLWSQDTFVDFEHGLNKAINKVRDALGDDADNPRFIETLPRRGYRFLAPVVPRISADAAVDALPAQDREYDKRGAPTHLQSGATRPWRRIGLWISAGMTAIVVIAAAIVAATPPRPPRVLRYTQLTNDGLNKFDPPVTDGSSIYFGEQDSHQRSIIAQVSVSGGMVSTLATFPGAPVSAFNYSQARSELLVGHVIGTESPVWALSVPGGSPPRRIGSFVVSDAAWSSDGQSIVYSKLNELYVVKADGSDARRLAIVTGAPSFVRFSPDGKVFRSTVAQNSAAGNITALWEMNADGSNLHPVFPDWQVRNDYAGSWTPNGKYFIFGSSTAPGGSDGSIFAIRERARFSGQSAPVQLTSGPLTFSTPVVSRNGKQIFAAGYLNRGELLRYEPKSRTWEPYLSGISAADLDFSKDGEWVTYVLVPEGTLWRSRVDGSERVQLTISPLRASMPRWSPDGKTIAFVGRKPGGVWTIYTTPADGGEAQQLFHDDKFYQDPNWSPDGNRLVFGEGSVQPRAIHVLDFQSHRVSDLTGSNGLFSPRWSPNGFIMAITAPFLPSTQTGSQSPPVKVLRFDPGDQKWKEVCETSFMAYPSFSRNGQYIHFSDSQGGFFRFDLASRKIEKVANINPPIAMKQDDFWYWAGLTPDDSPMFLRDTSTREIYALDVDFP